MALNLQSVPATVMPDGTVQLSEEIRLPFPAKAVVTVLIDDEISETAILSEDALADWNCAEEDKAWAHLQEAP